jgi:hypothetical protein
MPEGVTFRSQYLLVIGTNAVSMNEQVVAIEA